MSVIKLKNVSNTNYMFDNIGSIDDRGLVRGKKVGCVPGQNILVTNEEEIGRNSLLQQLITTKKLVPLVEKALLQNEVKSEPKASAEHTSSSADEDDEILSGESLNLIAGSEEDAKELEDYLNSEERAKGSRNIPKDSGQENSTTLDSGTHNLELTPDPKGSNGIDLYYEKAARNIMVDGYQKTGDTNLYPDEKKN